MKPSQFRQTQLDREQQDRKAKRAKVSSPTSSLDKPEFWERVEARLQRESTAAAIGKHYEPQAAQFQPPASAKEKFESAVAELMETETDGDRHAALQLAKTRHSGLLRQMMLEANR